MNAADFGKYDGSTTDSNATYICQVKSCEKCSKALTLTLQNFQIMGIAVTPGMIPFRLFYDAILLPMPGKFYAACHPFRERNHVFRQAPPTAALVAPRYNTI